MGKDHFLPANLFHWAQGDDCLGTNASIKSCFCVCVVVWSHGCKSSEHSEIGSLWGPSSRSLKGWRLLMCVQTSVFREKLGVVSSLLTVWHCDHDGAYSETLCLNLPTHFTADVFFFTWCVGVSSAGFRFPLRGSCSVCSFRLSISRREWVQSLFVTILDWTKGFFLRAKREEREDKKLETGGKKGIKVLI